MNILYELIYVSMKMLWFNTAPSRNQTATKRKKVQNTWCTFLTSVCKLKSFVLMGNRYSSNKTPWRIIHLFEL